MATSDAQQQMLSLFDAPPPILRCTTADPPKHYRRSSEALCSFHMRHLRHFHNQASRGRRGNETILCILTASAEPNRCAQIKGKHDRRLDGDATLTKLPSGSILFYLARKSQPIPFYCTRPIYLLLLPNHLYLQPLWRICTVLASSRPVEQLSLCLPA